MATAGPASAYRPWRPERTVLYRVLSQHFERFVQICDERFAPTRGPLARGAQEAVNRYLDFEDETVVPGAVGFIQTAGEMLGWHPHAHLRLSDGVFDRAGTFERFTYGTGASPDDRGRCACRAP
jgi:hypothetical protein